MRYIESRSTDPMFNLALEQYVFDHLPKNQSYLMLWQNDNSIIIGRHQNTVAEIDASFVAEHNIRVVRRLSGGGAVYHDMGNLNYTIITDAPGMERIDLPFFCKPVVSALQKMGVEATISGRNDVLVEGLKISGTAQYVREERVMHHGTLLFDSNLDVLSRALKGKHDEISSKSVRSVSSRVTNIRSFLKQDIDINTFLRLIRTELLSAEDAEPYTLNERDMESVWKLREERYACWDWNYGRSPNYSIQKKRRFDGVGTIQLCMDVERGVITKFATFGDYFGNKPYHALAEQLVGMKLERAALEEKINQLNIDDFYHKLSAQAFLSLLLE